VAIASAEEATNATAPIQMITSFKTLLTIIVVIPAIFLVPFFVVYFTLLDKEKWKDYPLAMPKGSVRALLAFSLIVLITIMLILFAAFNEIISALLAILALIVGYYFGQRSVVAEPKPKTDAEEIVEEANDYLDELKSI
jgi:amino acid transporter